jgi:maltose phosphorylase
MRSDGEKLVFNPSIPKGWTLFSFNILYRGSRINVKVSCKSVVLQACTGPAVEVKIFGKDYTVDSMGVELEMPADRLG